MLYNLYRNVNPIVMVKHIDKIIYLDLFLVTRCNNEQDAKWHI